MNHEKADNKNDRDKFKGSKYVQSDLRDIFLNVRSGLENNKMVLFTGTPCQTAGLRAFLNNKKYDNLVLCDLVCAGAPSPLLWKEYVLFLTKKTKSSIKRYSFRYKGVSWHKSSYIVELKDGKIMHNEPTVDIYSSIFNSHNALRPSCHNCVFANFERPSDLTIGDFWGIEKSKPHFDDDRGVSLVLINTEKGKEIFNAIKEDLVYEVSNTSECKQRNLTMPTPVSSKRDIFWKNYYEKGFVYVARKYTEYGVINRTKKYVIKPILKKIGILK